MTIDDIIEGVIGREGRYSNNPNDPGGATCWGITERVARKHGYTGPMQSLPRETAKDIYFADYVTGPGFAAIMPLSLPIACELVDTGVNMGQGIASTFLQEALNGLNQQGRDYPDVKEDGNVGPATIAALRAYLSKRGKDGETVLLRALNCLQGDRYIELARARQANEDFLFGWLKNRVAA